jgi:hypothetical protein
MKRFFDEGSDLGTGTTSAPKQSENKTPTQTASLTPELVEMMESRIQEGISKGLAEKTPALKEEWLNEYKTTQQQKKEEEQKAELLSKINGSESLKKMFDSYGIDHTTQDGASLQTYLNIFESKAKENTPAPKGAPVTPNKPNNLDVDTKLKNAFERIMGGQK